MCVCFAVCFFECECVRSVGEHGGVYVCVSECMSVSVGDGL